MLFAFLSESLNTSSGWSAARTTAGSYLPCYSVLLQQKKKTQKHFFSGVLLRHKIQFYGATSHKLIFCFNAGGFNLSPRCANVEVESRESRCVAASLPDTVTFATTIWY